MPLGINNVHLSKMSANAELSILMRQGLGERKWIDFSLEQYKNAHSPIYVTFVGMLIDSKLIQFLNECPSIFVILLPKVMNFKL